MLPSPPVPRWVRSMGGVAMHINPQVWWVRVCSVFFAFGLASAAVVALAPQARAITIVDCAGEPAALQPAIDAAPTGTR
jgi:hypothetical protein